MWYEFRSNGKRQKTGYYLLVEADSLVAAQKKVVSLGADLRDYRGEINVHPELEYLPLGLGTTPRPVAELVSNAPDFGGWQAYNTGIPPDSHANGMVIVWADGRTYLSNGVQL